MVSLIGSWTQITTLIWLAQANRSSAKWPAFLAAVQIGPTFLLGPWGGALADRMPCAALIVRTQSAFLTCALILLGLYLSDQLTVGAMLAGACSRHGVVQAIDLPARLAFVPSLVDRKTSPMRCALNSLLFNVAGPWGRLSRPTARVGRGVLVFRGQRPQYLAVIGALVLMRVRPPEAHSTAPTEGRRRFSGSESASAGLLTLMSRWRVWWPSVAGPCWPCCRRLRSSARASGEGGYGTLLSLGRHRRRGGAHRRGDHRATKCVARCLLLGGLDQRSRRSGRAVRSRARCPWRRVVASCSVSESSSSSRRGRLLVATRGRSTPIAAKSWASGR